MKPDMRATAIPAGEYANHVDSLAHIHASAYTGDHLTAHFSRGMLRKYYRLIIEASDICIIARDNATEGADQGGHDIGFIVAGEHVSRGVTRYLRRHGVYVLMVLMRNPRLALEKAAALWCGRRGKPEPSALVPFRLFSIAVHSRHQSRGVGGIMLDCLEKNLRKRQVAAYGLSVRIGNGRAAGFYERHGFSPVAIGRNSMYYEKRIDTDAVRVEAARMTRQTAESAAVQKR